MGKGWPSLDQRWLYYATLGANSVKEDICEAFEFGEYEHLKAFIVVKVTAVSLQPVSR